MADLLASLVIVAAGCYFVALGLAAFLAPGIAARFLLGFAGSAAAHYLELGIRLVVGGALVRRSLDMMFGNWFFAFGWIILGTTAVLFTVPWRWHRRFAERAVPYALRFLRVFGLAAMALGTLVIVAVIRGP